MADYGAALTNISSPSGATFVPNNGTTIAPSAYQASKNAQGQFVAPDGTVLTAQTGPNSWSGSDGSVWIIGADGNPTRQSGPTSGGQNSGGGDSWWTQNSPTFSQPQPYSTPQWTGSFSAPPLPASLQQPYTLPTLAEAQQQPGYEFTQQAGEQSIGRAAAARGTNLNPGTVQALEQYNQGLATTNYGNVVNQDLAARNQNVSDYNNTFNQAFQQYAQKYGEFTNQSNMGLTGYQTNVNNSRNAQTDYWNELLGLSNQNLQALGLTQ